MCVLQDLDIQAKGIKVVTDEWWKQQHDEVRGVWRIEDLIRKADTCLKDAEQFYNDYRLGRLNNTGPFSYCVDVFRVLVETGASIIKGARECETKGYEVEGLAHLQRRLSEIQEIIDEDSFATDVSIYNIYAD